MTRHNSQHHTLRVVKCTTDPINPRFFQIPHIHIINWQKQHIERVMWAKCTNGALGSVDHNDLMCAPDSPSDTQRTPSKPQLKEWTLKIERTRGPLESHNPRLNLNRPYGRLRSCHVPPPHLVYILHKATKTPEYTRPRLPGSLRPRSIWWPRGTRFMHPWWHPQSTVKFEPFSGTIGF